MSDWQKEFRAKFIALKLYGSLDDKGTITDAIIKYIDSLLLEQKKEIEESYKKGRLMGSYTREQIRSKCCDKTVYVGNTVNPEYFCYKCHKRLEFPEGIYFI